MEIKYNIIIALFCYLTILYHINYSFEIITHPYMVFLLLTLFLVGGYHTGCLIAKSILFRKSKES